MQHGRSIRPRPPSSVGYARMVKSVRDTDQDKFELLPLVEEWLAYGAVKLIDLGPNYPNSFMTAGRYPA